MKDIKYVLRYYDIKFKSIHDTDVLILRWVEFSVEEVIRIAWNSHAKNILTGHPKSIYNGVGVSSLLEVIVRIYERY